MIALNLQYNKNKLCETLNYWSRDMLNCDFPEKVQGQVSPWHFVYDFSRKMFLMLCSIKWPSFIVWFRQYLNYNCLLTKLWCHKIWIHHLFNQAVLLHDQKVKTKLLISWEWKKLSRWNEKRFSSFWKGFQLPHCHRPESAPLRSMLKLLNYAWWSFWKNCNQIFHYFEIR